MKQTSIFCFLIFLFNITTSFGQTKIASYYFNGDATDGTGNGHNATVFNGAALTSDRFGRTNSAYSFDGVNDYLSIPHSSSFNLNSLTISGWVYPISTSSPYDGFINKKDSLTNVSDIKGIGTAANTQMVRSSVKYTDNTANEPSGTPGLTLNQWSHVVYIFDKGNIKIYVNGTLIVNNTSSNGKTIAYNTAPFTIGVTYWFPSSQFNKYYWNGKIDDINIYSGALTDCQVASLYTENNGLVASYPLNGSSNDESGNNHHGTPYGVVSTTDRFGNSDGALLFDGVNDYISIPHSSSFDMDVFTISGWVYPITTPTSYHGFINKKDSITNVSNTKSFGTVANTNGVRFSAKYTDATANEPGAANPVVLNKWSNVVYVYNNGNIKIYLNGALALNSTAGNGKTLSKNTAPITIGVTYWFPSIQFNKYYWNGKIDDVNIYNRELSACEISSLYSTSTPTGILHASAIKEPEILVYPNPVKDQFTFDLEEKDIKSNISIVDALGRECKDVRVTNNNSKVSVDLSEKEKGIYYLIINNEGATKTAKIIKE